jgi:GntR family transcriptional regulator/MocR family aminotransferase
MKRTRRKPQAFPLDMLLVDRNATEPLHRQLYKSLVALIRNRTLPAGSELPSTRSLAVELALGRNTVVAAYEQLITEGYLSNRQGARPVIVDLPDGPQTAPVREGGVPAVPMSRRGAMLMRQPSHIGLPGQIAFHPGIPDAETFPFGVWGRIVARRASHGGDTLFGTYDITGHPALKEAISGYLQTARGVRCQPDNVVITTGAQAAFDLLARLLLDPGDLVWMEEPGYYGTRAAFSVAGARIQPMAVDPVRGWALDEPEEQPRLIYVTPACQHPLGITMRMEERLRLLEIAESANAWVIEDDFDGEYRFQGQPVPAMQSMDRSGRVIYVGTFSKLLFPALRIGFMVVPKELAARLPHALSTTGQFAPLLLQAALADFITDGHMNRHLKRMRRIYTQRQQAFRDTVRDTLGAAMMLSPVATGIQIVGYLGHETDDTVVTGNAARRAINVSPLSKYFLGAPTMNGLVLGYAACDRQQMTDGMIELAAAIAESRHAFRT